MKRLKLAIILLGAALVLGASALWYVGGALSAPVNQTLGPPPSDVAAQPVLFPSPSGSTIHGWLIPGEPGRGAIVLLHGLRSNRQSMTSRARFLSRAGYAVLLFDFQAHGESPGRHITFGYLEGKDAQAAVQFMRERLPGEKIGVLGVSMGGAATLLAEPPLKVDAAVLEMVYPTIEEAIADRLKMRLGEWGGRLSPVLSLLLKPRLGVSAEELRPVSRVAGMPAPKLFIAGEEDRHTTLEESRRMYGEAREPKEMWVVAGAAHVDLHAHAGEEYERRVLAFFERNVGS